MSTETREMMEMMEAGRALDAAVAEEVMGWVRELGSFAGTNVWHGSAVMLVPPENTSGLGRHPTMRAVTYTGNVPHFSTDIDTAMQVVERLMDEAAEFRIRVWGGGVRVLVEREDYDGGIHTLAEEESHDRRELPLVLCRAALAAVRNL